MKEKEAILDQQAWFLTPPLITPDPLLTSPPDISSNPTFPFPLNLLRLKIKKIRGYCRSTGLVPFSVPLNPSLSSLLTSLYPLNLTTAPPRPAGLSPQPAKIKIKEKESVLGL